LRHTANKQILIGSFHSVNERIATDHLVTVGVTDVPEEGLMAEMKTIALEVVDSRTCST
jgi:hypothetical protein